SASWFSATDLRRLPHDTPGGGSAEPSTSSSRAVGGRVRDPGVIWPRLSTRAPRNSERFLPFLSTFFGVLLTASLFTASVAFFARRQPGGCTKQLSKGRPSHRHRRDDCGGNTPAPSNPCTRRRRRGRRGRGRRRRGRRRGWRRCSGGRRCGRRGRGRGGKGSWR